MKHLLAVLVIFLLLNPLSTVILFDKPKGTPIGIVYPVEFVELYEIDTSTRPVWCHVRTSKVDGWATCLHFRTVSRNT